MLSLPSDKAYHNPPPCVWIRQADDKHADAPLTAGGNLLAQMQHVRAIRESPALPVR